MNKPTRPGFTLIELLVVISIISLLISLLLPALKAARESGRTMQCLSSQRQVVMAMFVYHNDSGSFIPYYYRTFTTPTVNMVYAGKYASYNWANAMWKQNLLIDAPSVLTCPSFDEGEALPDPVGTDASSLNKSHFGYAYHFIGSSYFETYLNMPDSVRWTIPARQDDIAKPSETYILMDTVAKSTTAVGVTQGGYVVNASDASSKTFVPWARHGSGRQTLNITYVDGHAASTMLTNRLLPYDDLGEYTDADNRWDRK